MKIKMLALDLDGTTLCSDHATLSPANREAIQWAIDHNIEVVIATGRMRNRIPRAMASIPQLRYLITSNGAAVVDRQTAQTLYVNPLSKEKTAMVLNALEEFPVYAEIYANGAAFTDQAHADFMEQFPMPKWRVDLMKESWYVVADLKAHAALETTIVEKINMPYLPPLYWEPIWEKLQSLPELSIVSSTPQNCEVNDHTANKGDALVHLCAHLGIAPDQVLALGDNDNDLELLQAAGTAAVPSNGTQKALDLADAVLPDCDHDAVAHAVHLFLRDAD